MCELFGVTVLKGTFKNRLDKAALATLFNSLGMKAANRSHTDSGVLIANDDGFNVYKNNKAFEQIIVSQDYLHFINNLDEENTYSIFGYSVGPSVGSSVLLKDINPFIEDRVVGFFEGKIDNVDDIYKLPTFKDFKSKSTQKNEVVAQLFNYYKNVHRLSSITSFKRMREKLEGPMNAVLFNTLSPSSVHIFKTNNNPLCMHFFEDCGLLLFSSISSYTMSVANMMRLGTSKQIILSRDTGIIICADSSKYEIAPI